MIIKLNLEISFDENLHTRNMEVILESIKPFNEIDSEYNFTFLKPKYSQNIPVFLNVNDPNEVLMRKIVNIIYGRRNFDIDEDDENDSLVLQ